MRTSAALALLACIMVVSSGGAVAAEDSKPSPRNDGGQSFDELGRDFREWLSRWWRYVGGTTAQEQQPVISLLLRNRERLELSDDQVKKLEQLRSDFEKETIRNEADIRVAEIDLTNLLKASNADPGKIEAKVREIERLRGDLRIARIRAIEKGKALLSSDQRKRFEELLSEQRFTRFQSSAR